MTCQEIGFVQAYMDGELSRDERKEFARHLERCPSCQKLVGELDQLEKWTQMAIKESRYDQPSAQEIDTKAAWERFQASLAHTHKGSGAAYETDQHMNRSWNTMKKTYKNWIVGTSAAAVLFGAFSIPQVQAVASDVLSIFRVNQVEFIKLTESDMHDIASWFDNNAAGEQEIKGIGKIWTKEAKNREPQFFDTAEQAKKAGYTLPAVPAGYQGRSFSISQAFTVYAQLDTEKANKLLRQLKADTQFDDKLNGKEFSLTVPQSIGMMLTKADQAPTTHISYDVINAPEIQAPKDVDLNSLRDTVLSLPFIPENVKRQLGDIEDWKHTLPIPYMEGNGDHLKEIKINGTQAILYQNEHDASLVWQKDGKLHKLHMNGQSINTNQLIEIAKEL
ncbi:zf-HC2 domain-containing protein [Brevibacillus dissolubilis]|uniref:zf-HC2 domain-containing protein n=1 Tax=Brevibacillus dissolubilis TaxID=1844116 RepID=UPI0011177490|nr:zf-HC2 domain-containing protein [Brevibacillus dissolubilis]